MSTRFPKFMRAMISIAIAVLASVCADARPLLVGVQLKSRAAVVYELPQAGQRKDAVAYIKSVWNVKDKGVDVIDAAEIAPESKDRLKSGFVLYTTLDRSSSLLQKTIGPLDIKIKKHGLIFHGREYIGDDLSFIFVGTNPYADGKIVVFAASTNEGLRHIHEFPAGPHSYHLYKGRSLLLEGDYDEDFEVAKTSLTVAEALEDANELFSSLEDVHPDLLAKVRAEDYLDLKTRVATEIKSKFNRDGVVRLKDLAYSLFYVIAFFRDGHTRFNWWAMRDGALAPNAQSAAGMRFPPFVLKFQYGKMYVDQALQRDLNGMEITAINGEPIMQFLKPILERYSGETMDYRAASIFRGSAQEFWWYLADLLSPADKLTATLMRQPGVKLERTLATIDFGAFHELAIAANQALRAKRSTTPLAFLDDGKTAVFTYLEFKDTQQERERIDRIFQEITNKQARALIIDLRGNGGGSAAIGQFMMRYLTTRKFRMDSKFQVKISRRILSKPDCKSIAGYDCAKMSPFVGQLVTKNFEEEQLEKPEAFYQGRVYILVDQGTYSEGSLFASWVRDYDIGEIIGYETAFPPTNFGEMYEARLRHSLMPYWVCYIKFYGPRPGFDTDEHGVIPNVQITDEILGKYKDREDPILAFATDYVKRRRK